MSDQPATDRASLSFRFVVHVMPKSGILDPQGRAVERSMPHLGVTEVRDVRVGRRIELTVEAADEAAARTVVDRLATELLANPLIESHAIELVGAVAAAAGPEPAGEEGGRAQAGPAQAGPAEAGPEGGA